MWGQYPWERVRDTEAGFGVGAGGAPPGSLQLLASCSQAAVRVPTAPRGLGCDRAGAGLEIAPRQSVSGLLGPLSA